MKSNATDADSVAYRAGICAGLVTARHTVSSILEELERTAAMDCIAQPENNKKRTFRAVLTTKKNMKVK